jgi:hypothetical protein
MQALNSILEMMLNTTFQNFDVLHSPKQNPTPSYQFPPMYLLLSDVADNHVVQRPKGSLFLLQKTIPEKKHDTFNLSAVPSSKETKHGWKFYS